MARRASTSVGPTRKPEQTLERLSVPVALLLAAETVSAKADSEDPRYQSILLMRDGERGRIVSSDRRRMFLASFPLPETVPSWLDGDGLLIDQAGLKTRLAVLKKLHSTKFVRLDYGAGMTKVIMSDQRGEDSFAQPVWLGARFPLDYGQAIDAGAFSSIDLDSGEYERRDWEPVGINSVHFRHIGELTKLLESGLDKKPPNGTVVRSFNSGRDDIPMVFCFSTAPNVLLSLMPEQNLQAFRLDRETAILLEPQAKHALAAYRAHATRWRMKAEGATNKADREAFLARAADFDMKAARHIRMTGLTALESPETKPAEPKEAGIVAEPETKEDGEAVVEAEQAAMQAAAAHAPVARKRAAAKPRQKRT